MLTYITLIITNFFNSQMKIQSINQSLRLVKLLSDPHEPSYLHIFKSPCFEEERSQSQALSHKSNKHFKHHLGCYDSSSYLETLHLLLFDSRSQSSVTENFIPESSFLLFEAKMTGQLPKLSASNYQQHLTKNRGSAEVEGIHA